MSHQRRFCVNCIDQRVPRRRRRETDLRLKRAACLGHFEYHGYFGFPNERPGAQDLFIRVA